MIILHFHLGECLPNSLFSPNSPFLSKSPVSKGIPLPSHLNFCSELWRMFAIFVIYAKLAIFVKIAISFQFFLRLWYFPRGPLCHLIRHFRHNPHFQRAPLSYHLNFSQNWRMFAIFAIFAKIATLKVEPLPRHRNIRQTLARVRHFCHFRQIRLFR